MKKATLLILTLAASALLVGPALAAPADASRLESAMQHSIEKMQDQMEKINKTKKPKERLKLLQAHNDSMRDSIGLMREMMGGDHCDHMKKDHMAGRYKAGDQCDHKRTGNKECGHCDHKMGGGKACDQCEQMKKDRMADRYKAGDQCDHKRGGNTGSGDADSAPAAQSTLGQLAADKTSSGAAKKIWVCPMHPEVAQDHPGYCPKCGMDLIEVEQPDTAQAEPMRMKELTGSHMGMMLILMEQMIEHNEALMPLLK